LVDELNREQPKTTKELLDIGTRHTSSDEAVGTAFVLGNAEAATNGGRATTTKATIMGARKGNNGGRKGKNWQLRRVTIVAGNGGSDEETDVSSEVCVAATEHDFKRQVWPPKDHFEKLLVVTCPHHPYPVKHKLKDCTMMKNFMTPGAFSKGMKPRGTQAGKVWHPFPGKWRSRQSSTNSTSDPGMLHD
jgi:hypothetical protein